MGIYFTKTLKMDKKNTSHSKYFITFNQANGSKLILKTVRFRGGNSGVRNI
jgi:hypothetical protein